MPDGKYQRSSHSIASTNLRFATFLRAASEACVLARSDVVAVKLALSPFDNAQQIGNDYSFQIHPPSAPVPTDQKRPKQRLLGTVYRRAPEGCRLQYPVPGRLLVV